MSVCENCSKTNKHIYNNFFQIESNMYIFFFKKSRIVFERHLEALSFGLVRVATIFLLFLQLHLGHFFCVIISLGHLLLFLHTYVLYVVRQYNGNTDLQPVQIRKVETHILRFESCRGLRFFTVVRLNGVTTE